MYTWQSNFQFQAISSDEQWHKGIPYWFSPFLNLIYFILILKKILSRILFMLILLLYFIGHCTSIFRIFHHRKFSFHFFHPCTPPPLYWIFMPYILYIVFHSIAQLPQQCNTFFPFYHHSLKYFPLIGMRIIIMLFYLIRDMIILMAGVRERERGRNENGTSNLEFRTKSIACHKLKIFFFFSWCQTFVIFAFSCCVSLFFFNPDFFAMVSLAGRLYVFWLLYFPFLFWMFYTLEGKLI